MYFLQLVLSLCLWNLTLGGRPLNRDKAICSNVKITGQSMNIDNKLKKLAKCTVIEGYLWLQKLDIPKNYSITHLKLVTDYVVLHEIRGLESIENLLPKLFVIRGISLHHGFGLLIDTVCCDLFCPTSNQGEQRTETVIALKEVDTWRLSSIMKGSVWLKDTILLCLKPNSYWENLTGKFYWENNVFENNMVYCPLLCDGDFCSLYKEYGSVTNDTRCHKECLGGQCFKYDDPKSCVGCRNFISNGECFKNCPSGYLEYKDYRCVDPAECRRLDGLFFNKTLPILVDENSFDENRGDRCLHICPDGYNQKRSESEGMPDVCLENNGICGSASITNYDLGSKLRNCTIIEGDMDITVERGNNVAAQLERNLGSIEEITGQLSVVGANILLSLNFLKRLQTIGSHFNERNVDKFKDRYSLFIFNNDLRELWNWKSRDNSSIPLVVSGSVYIQHNDFLCPAEIEKLKANAIIGDKYISREGNGRQIQCEEFTTTLLSATGSQSGTVFLKWFQHYDGLDDRNVVSYHVYYREAPTDITMYEGRDAYNDENGFRDIWSKDIVILKKGLRHGCFSHTVKRLEPSTRYGFYIRSFGLVGDGSDVIISEDIIYATTAPEAPTAPGEGKILPKNGNVSASWRPAIPIPGYEIFYEVTLIYSGEPESLDFLYSNGSCDEFTEMLKAKSVWHYESEMVMTYEASRQNINTFIKKEVPALKGSCFCEDEKEMVRAHRNGVELHRAIQRITLPQVSLKKVMNVSTTALRPVPKEPRSDCTNMTLDWSDSDLTHVALNTYDKTWVDRGEYFILKMRSALPSMTFSLPPRTEGLKRLQVEVRSCIKNATDCAAVGLNPPCGRCSNYHSWNWSIPLKDGVNYISSLTLEEVDNPDDGRPSHPVVNVTWSVDASIERFISGYKIIFFPTGSPQSFREECFSKTTTTGYPRGSYLVNLLTAGETYNISLKAITHGRYIDGQQIAKSDVISIKSSDYYTMVWIWVSVGTLVLFVVGVVGKGTHDCLKIIKSGPKSVSVNDGYKKAHSWDTLPEEDYLPPEDMTLNRKIGEGEYGLVYTATLKNKLVAAKKLHEAKTEDSLLNGFIDEYKISRDLYSSFLQSPIGVVNDMRNTVLQKRTIFILYDLLEHNLKTFLKEETVKEHVKIEILAQVADGMAYLHQKNIVHRDLAARNIMVNRECNWIAAKIIDFGMAKRLDGYGSYIDNYDSNRLIPVRWAAPEVLREERCEHTRKSDSYSFGTLAYEVDSDAKSPFQHLNMKNAELKDFLLSERDVFLPGIETEIKSAILKSVIECSCSRLPENRPSMLDIENKLLNNTSHDFMCWFESKKPFYRSTECRKDSESAESGFCAAYSSKTSTSQELDASQSIQSCDEDEDDGTGSGTGTGTDDADGPLLPGNRASSLFNLLGPGGTPSFSHRIPSSFS